MAEQKKGVLGTGVFPVDWKPNDPFDPKGKFDSFAAVRGDEANAEARIQHEKTLAEVEAAKVAAEDEAG